MGPELWLSPFQRSTRRILIIKNSLICHDDAACTVLQRLNTELLALPNGDLRLRYELTVDPARLWIPAPLPPEMTDGLWEHTCFEAFIAVAGHEAYREFNFSPSGQWAAYAFSGYRIRCEWTASRPPLLDFTQTDEGLQLEAIIAADDLPPNPEDKPLQVGLTAVIETVDGLRSYWALRHPASKPDFHHRDGFVQSLKA